MLRLSLSLGWGHTGACLSAYLLVFGVFIKAGASPFFFFKLEVYKGLPLLPLVFYSLTYLLVFSLVFFLFFLSFLPTLFASISQGLLILLAPAMLYLGCSLTGLPTLRSFFALSSAVNSLLLWLLLLCFFI